MGKMRSTISVRTWRVSVATTLLSPTQNWDSRRPTPLLLPVASMGLVALGAHVADRSNVIFSTGSAKEMT